MDDSDARPANIVLDSSTSQTTNSKLIDEVLPKNDNLPDKADESQDDFLEEAKLSDAQELTESFFAAECSVHDEHADDNIVAETLGFLELNDNSISQKHEYYNDVSSDPAISKDEDEVECLDLSNIFSDHNYTSQELGIEDDVQTEKLKIHISKFILNASKPFTKIDCPALLNFVNTTIENITSFSSSEIKKEIKEEVCDETRSDEQTDLLMQSILDGLDASDNDEDNKVNLQLNQRSKRIKKEATLLCDNNSAISREESANVNTVRPHLNEALLIKDEFIDAEMDLPSNVDITTNSEQNESEKNLTGTNISISNKENRTEYNILVNPDTSALNEDINNELNLPAADNEVSGIQEFLPEHIPHRNENVSNNVETRCEANDLLTDSNTEIDTESTLNRNEDVTMGDQVTNDQDGLQTDITAELKTVMVVQNIKEKSKEVQSSQVSMEVNANLTESEQAIELQQDTLKDFGQSDAPSPCFHENCSEPLEHALSEDFGTLLGSQTLVENIPPKLETLISFAKSLNESCSSFASAFPSSCSDEKLQEFISEHFSKFRSIVDFSKNHVDQSTQTEPRLSSRRLKRLNSENKKALLESSSSLESSSDSSSELSYCSSVSSRAASIFSKSTNSNSAGRKESMEASNICDAEENGNHKIHRSDSEETPLNSASQSPNINRTKVDGGISQSESDKENTGSINKTQKRLSTNSDAEDDEDKEIERLINLNALDKRQTKGLALKSFETEKHKSQPERHKNKATLIDFLENNNERDAASEDSFCESEEEIITETQYLARYNENLKQQLINGSSTDSDESGISNDELLESQSDEDGNKPPRIDKFLQSFNVDDSDEEMNEADGNDKQTLLNKDKVPENPDDMNNMSPHDSDCDILGNNSLFRKEQRPKSLEKMLSEAEKRKKIHEKAEEDLISLSSESESSGIEAVDLEPEVKSRIIKPMLRQDQLASETRKAQRHEVDRIRRLEKKQATLARILKEKPEATQANELILDYNEQTKTFIKVHPGIVKHLKPHQIEGVRFMYDSCYGGVEALKKSSGSGCILAHCMGLGKTLQLIALLHTVISYKELNTSKILVLCPKSTVMNWADEILRWLGPLQAKNLKVSTFNDVSDINEKLNILREWSLSTQQKAGCLLLGYEAFRTLIFYHSYKNRGNLTAVQIEEVREKVDKYLLQPGADLVVCDEGHIIKNSKSAISLAVAKIITPKRIVLTGTPIQNNLKEYYSMVNFIKPLFLGTEKEFANLYANPIKNGQHKDSSKRDIKVMKQRSFVLHKKLSKFVQRKEAELLKTFLPAKFEYVLFVPMTTEQNNLYEHILEAITRREENRGRGLITDYTCLRKIWTHPKVLEDAWKNATSQKSKRDARRLHQIVHSDDDQPDDIYDSQTGVMSVTNDWWRHLVTEKDLESIFPSNKLRTMFEILRMCDEKEEKCLIFSAFVAVLNVVEYFFNKISNGQLDTQTELNMPLSKFKNRWINGQDYYRLDGKTPKTIRHEMIKRFNSPLNKRARVFLISAKAGGQGINLTGANRVIILDTSWNPSNDQQNIFRIFRLGQKRNCYIYRLLAMGTMEEKVYSRSVTKQAMSFRVVDEQQIDRHYNMAELAELYTLTKPNYAERPLPQFPQDSILASLLRTFPHLVYKFHEHDSLLENKVEQELSEQEKADAWAAYERDLQLSSEIRDLPVMNDAHNNFAAAKMQSYFGPDMGLPSFLNYQNIGQQTGASPFMQSLFPHFNYQNPLPTHSYFEMMNFYRKFAQPPPTGHPTQPTSLPFPDINKPMGENAFNSSSYVPTGQSTSSNSALLSRLQPNNLSNSNPLSALGDLTAFGMGAPKAAHNNSATALPHHHPASIYTSPGPSTPNPSIHLNSTPLLSAFDTYKQSLETYNNMYDFNSNTSKSSVLMNNLPQLPYSGPQLNVQPNNKSKDQIPCMETVKASPSEQSTVKSTQNEKSILPEFSSKKNETSNKSQSVKKIGTTLDNAESNKDPALLSRQVPFSHSERSSQKQNSIIQKASKSLSSPTSSAQSSSRSIKSPSANAQNSRCQQSPSSIGQNTSPFTGQSLKYVNTGQNPISLDSLPLNSTQVSKLLTTTDIAQESRTMNSLTSKSNNSPSMLDQTSIAVKPAKKQITTIKEKPDSLAIRKKAAFNSRGINEIITPHTSSSPSGNMGIVYPSKQKQILSSVDPPLMRNNEMQIIPTTSPPGTTSISKQFTKLSPSISVTAVQNSNAKNNSQIRKLVNSPNTVSINRNSMSIPSNGNKNSKFIQKIPSPVSSNELAKKNAPVVLGKAPNLSNYRGVTSTASAPTSAASATSPLLLPQRSSTSVTKTPIVKKIQHSINTKIIPTAPSAVELSSTATAAKTSNALHKMQPSFNSGKSYISSSLSSQPPPAIAQNGPKRGIGQYAPPVSGVRSTLNIRPADKQNPSGTGVYIIETNINEKKLAIGTPTKGGGGTTVTKVSVAKKRKAPDVICIEPKQAKK